MKRDSVVIYRNLFEALQNVSDKSYKRIMNAILKYSMDGEELELNGVEKAVFQLAKTQVDANNKKYENGKKGAEFGSLGGRPKKPQENPTKTPSDPLNDKCKMINDNYLKESKNLNINNNTTRTYEDVMEDFQVSDILKPVLFEFIKHCQLNGKKITNDKLEDLIIELDRRENEYEKIMLVKNAINGGYFDVKRGAI